MSRPAIPPSGPKTPSKETVSVLQRRLAAAEDDTQTLIVQLKDMGFDQKIQDEILAGQQDLGHMITTYPTQVTDPETLQRNYENVVSRVCKLESIIQTLKLNLLRTTTERDLNKKESASTSEKLRHAAEIYELELQKLNRELATSRKECKQMTEQRRKAVEDVRRLQDALELASNSKTESTVEANELRSAHDKLKRKLRGLQEELSRESELRASLEQSHQTMLQRIQDTEDVVSKEHAEMANLNTTCIALKRDLVKATEHANREEELRKRSEEAFQMNKKQAELYVAKVKASENEKALLESELAKMRTKYHELNEQLDQMYTIMQEKKDGQEALEKENKNLYGVMKNAASQNAELISKYEEELEKGRSELAQRLGECEKLKCLEEKLKEESKAKAHAETKNTVLEERVEDLTNKVSYFEIEIKEKSEKHKKDVTRLKEKLRSQETEKEHALKDKECLLDEVNQAVDGMSEEREKLVSDLQKTKVELSSIQQAKEQLEDENSTLHQRLGALEEQRSSHEQVQAMLTGLQEEKSKLAYDKGRLQSRVNQLQKELEALADGQLEHVQSKKLVSALESKLQQTQSELNSARMMVKRLEAQLQQSNSSGERKEGDFARAIKVRDEAVKEAQKLLQYAETVEGREHRKISNLQKNLMESRDDNKKMSETLEGLMSSHAKLQTSIDGLQLELGRKDAMIAQFEKERSEQKIAMRQLEKEIANLQSKLVAMETVETREVHPLRQALQKCKTDNAKMAASLEAVVKANGQLQASSEELQNQLEKKTHILDKLQEAREGDQKVHKDEVQSYEERLTSMKDSLTKERDRSLKKTNKEVAEVRKQMEDLLSKNGELSRTNSELRHKLTEVEYTVKEHKDKLASQKGQIEHLMKVRQKQDETMESMKGIGEQLTELEKTKTQYIRKNEQQAKTIKKFIKQTSALQLEVKSLAESQVETAELIQQQERELQKERQYNEKLREKYKLDSRKYETKIDDLRTQTASKLQETANESISMSHNLHDAHEWFKGKFDGLQSELVKSRKSQAQLEQENYLARSMLTEERRKAEETAERAREMIRASRETISRLADYAETVQTEKQQEYQVMKMQLQAEREQAQHAAEKLNEFQESSFRQTEDLARELGYLKSFVNS